MTPIEILREIHDETMNKVFASSSDWHMNRPKKGFEAEFERYIERAEALQHLIRKLES